MNVSGSTTDVLDVDLRAAGEVDNSAMLVDLTDPTTPRPITIMFEVKNTRQWYYEKDTNHGADLYRFLHKAALVQANRQTRPIDPAGDRRPEVPHHSLATGQTFGFLPVWIDHQLVLPSRSVMTADDQPEPGLPDSPILLEVPDSPVMPEVPNPPELPEAPRRAGGDHRRIRCP